MCLVLYNIQLMSSRPRKYLERTIDYTAGLLEHPQAADYFGNYLPMLQNSLGKLVICPVNRKGIVKMPKAARNTDAIPITPHMPGQKLWTGEDFASFSPAQLANLRTQLASLVPEHQVAQEVKALDKLLAGKGAFVQAGKDADISPAWVSFRHCSFRLKPGEYPNTECLRGSISARPLLGMEVPEDDSSTGPLLDLVHELVHIDQVTREPLRLYEKHEDSVLRHWERELEAYHVGAAGAAFGEAIGDREIIADRLGSAALQTAVEVARLAYNPPEDPFAVDATLLMQIDRITTEWYRNRM